MKLREKIEQLEQKKLRELYTVYCNITMLDDGKVRLEFEPDVYALVNEDEIDTSLIFPLDDGDDPFELNSRYAIKLAKGTNVELHVKKITHKFKVADTRSFYIDDKDELVYLDKQTQTNVDADPRCNKRVYVSGIRCCGNGRRKRGYGWVSCDDGWHDLEFCCS